MNKPKPIAVLISDVHYKESTLQLADTAYRAALRKAEFLEVPLIDCGDTLDEKGNIKASCANALIETLETATVRVYILVGNHTMINSKGREHALNFLKPYAHIIQRPVFVEEFNSWLVPYYDKAEDLKRVLSEISKGSRIIGHWGVQTADMGHYITDTSSLPPEEFADYRVICGHYHKAQNIKCGRPRKGAVGLFSYIGSPYTQSFGEAKDGPKGFQILYDDGSLELVPFDLRRHVVVETSPIYLPAATADVRPQDLLWLKLRGHKSELDKLKKQEIAKIIGRENFKLDLIPLEPEYTDDTYRQQLGLRPVTDDQVLDGLIDGLNEPLEWKTYLKDLWKEIIS